MFTNRLRDWTRQQPSPLRGAMVEAWNTTGVRVGEVDGNPVVRLGRAAALLRGDGRVETTSFMRQDPVAQAMDAGVHEAAWSSVSGAVFNAHPTTGDPSALDNAGMHAAAGSWADFMGCLRLRLLAREAEMGRFPWLENKAARSAGFGTPLSTQRCLTASLAVELSSLLSDEFTRAAAEALAWWRSRLPKRILHVMNASAWNSPDRWNWLVIDDRRPQPRRIQALEIFPWACDIIRTPALLGIVDKGEALTEALAATLNKSLPAQHPATPALIRQMRFMPARRDSACTPVSMARHVQECHGAVPATMRGWNCWYAAIVTCQRLGLPNMQARMGEWDSLDEERFVRALHSLGDAMQDLYATLFRPLSMLLGEQVPNVMEMQLMCMTQSPQQVMHRTEAWLSDAGQARRQLLHDWPLAAGHLEDMDSGWPPLHASWNSGYGLHAVLLTSDEELEAESRALDHCVRGYGSRCRLSGVHIISWRTGDGESVATQEIRQEGVIGLAHTRVEPFAFSRALPPGTVQLMGCKNAIPPDKAFLAAWSHASAIATGTLALDATLLDREMVMRQCFDTKQGWAVHAGWNLQKPQAARAAVRAYRAILPKRLRESLERGLRATEQVCVPAETASAVS